MTMIQLIINGGFISSLMVIGIWLENINGLDGWADQFFTPVPLGVFGLLTSFVSWHSA